MLKINLFDLDRQALRDFFTSIGEKSFRAEQIMKWLYHFGQLDLDQMLNLNKALRSTLKDKCSLQLPEISRYQKSTDGTIKFAMKLHDGQEIESVYIPEEDRATICISSQVGCALACSFCSTGNQGFNRNLSTFEIIGQIWKVSEFLGFQKETGERPISNVVLMGMGEPLLNVNNVVSAINIMLDDFGFGLSKRRVTISTSGVVPALLQLIGKVDVALAVSLHASNDTLRSKIMPINNKYPLNEFLDAIRKYIESSKANRDKVTVEYVLLDRINDSMEQAHELAKLMKNTPCKINLIPFNPYQGSGFKKPSNSRIDRFQKVLMEYGFTVIIRKTRGDDIDAACGQLVGDVKDRIRNV